MPAGSGRSRARVIHTLGYPLRMEEFGGGFIYAMPDGRALGRLRRRARLPGSDVRSARRASSTSSGIRSCRGLLDGRPDGALRREGAARRRLAHDPARLRRRRADRRRRRRVPELDAPQGHPPRDAHRHARRRDARSTRSRRATRRRRACRRYEDAIDASDVRRELYPVRNVHQSFGYGLLAGLAYSGLSLVTGGWWFAIRCRRTPATSGCRSSPTTTATARPDPDAHAEPGEDRSPAHVRSPHERALLGHAARRGSALAPDRPRHRHLPDALPRGVRQPVHAVLSGERLRDGRRRRRHEAAADQRLELRPLQDVRHHGSVSDHRLGAARGGGGPDYEGM